MTHADIEDAGEISRFEAIEECEHFVSLIQIASGDWTVGRCDANRENVVHHALLHEGALRARIYRLRLPAKSLNQIKEA